MLGREISSKSAIMRLDPGKETGITITDNLDNWDNWDNYCRVTITDNWDNYNR